jgi:hypothetical protein
MGWETTIDDLQTVLHARGITVDEHRLQDIYDLLDFASIEDGVYHYTTIESQTASMLCDIEDQLADEGILPKDGKVFFTPPDDEEDDADDDDW